MKFDHAKMVEFLSNHFGISVDVAQTLSADIQKIVEIDNPGFFDVQFLWPKARTFEPIVALADAHYLLIILCNNPSERLAFVNDLLLTELYQNGGLKLREKNLNKGIACYVTLNGREKMFTYQIFN